MSPHEFAHALGVSMSVAASPIVPNGLRNSAKVSPDFGSALTGLNRSRRRPPWRYRTGTVRYLARTRHCRSPSRSPRAGCGFSARSPKQTYRPAAFARAMIRSSGKSTCEPVPGKTAATLSEICCRGYSAVTAQCYSGCLAIKLSMSPVRFGTRSFR